MERKIKDLSPGQSAWTLPWALHTAQGRQWLNPNYPAYSSPFGTAEMRVVALVPKDDSDERYYHARGATVELAPFGGRTDHVDHETWLEYHNRLVREYYDFDAEWALIKEICPEVEKAPAPNRVRRARRPRLHPFHVIAVAFLGVAVLNYTLGNIVAMAVWAISAVFMLTAATVATQR